MGRRTLMLIAALLLAALGTALVFLYVNAQTTGSGTLVAVYRVSTQIAAGTTGKEVSPKVTVVKRPQTEVPAGSLHEGALNSRSADRLAHTVEEGDILQDSSFVGADAVSTELLRDGKLAVEVTLNDASRAAGLLQAGSVIAIFATSSNVPTSGPTPSTAKEVRSTRMIMEGVKVLTAGQSAPPQFGTVPAQNVTLELTQGQAQSIIFALESGAGETDHLWFALQGKGFQPDPSATPVTALPKDGVIK